MKEFWGRYLPRAVDLLEKLVAGRLIDSKYRRHIASTRRHVDLDGLGSIPYYTPEIDEVYIDVALAFQPPGTVRPGVLDKELPRFEGRCSLKSLVGQAKPRILVILGVPGGGKTTLVQHTAAKICRTGRRGHRAVPIPIYLRDHVARIVEDPKVTLASLLEDAFAYGRKSDIEWLEHQLRNGRCVVLLDGLDEAASEENRQRVAKWVDRQIQTYPENDFVITSRPGQYNRAPIRGATVYQVCSLTDEQVTRFIHSWCLAVERGGANKLTDEDRAHAETAAEHLRKRLNDSPELYDLTTNPLLLTMIVTVYSERRDLPFRRVDLYQEICRVVLERQTKKGIGGKLDCREKEQLLRRLAFVMMCRNVRDLPRDEVLSEIRPVLRKMSPEVSAEEFLADVGLNGLLVEREGGVYSFAHLTFQEYLAAEHIVRTQPVDVLTKVVDDAWWRETILFYVAQADADRVVAACLSSAGVVALSLAFDCVTQARELSEELRGRLDELLATAFEAGVDAERRRFIARVLLVGHLGRFVRLGDEVHVCSQPMTADICALYFRDVYPARNIPLLAEPGAREAVTGISAGDAVRLLRWVNSIVSDGRVYRLPNREEIDSANVQLILNGAPNLLPWLRPSSADGRPELWVRPGADHPHEVGAATLAEHVQEDTERSMEFLGRLALAAAMEKLAQVSSWVESGRKLDNYRANELDLGHSLTLAVGLVRRHDPVFGYFMREGLFDDLVRLLSEACRSIIERDFNRGRIVVDAALLQATTLDGNLMDVLGELGDAINELRLDLDYAGVHELDSGRRDAVALSRALARTMQKDVTLEAWPSTFAQSLVVEAGVAESSYVVSLDDLSRKSETASARLLELVRMPGGRTRRQVVEHFAGVLTKTGMVSEHKGPATAPRLAALILAAEADDYGAHDLAETFREIAAGITLLELRAEGVRPPTETIILVSEAG